MGGAILHPRLLRALRVSVVNRRRLPVLLRRKDAPPELRAALGAAVWRHPDVVATDRAGERRLIAPPARHPPQERRRGPQEQPDQQRQEHRCGDDRDDEDQQPFHPITRFLTFGLYRRREWCAAARNSVPYALGRSFGTLTTEARRSRRGEDEDGRRRMEDGGSRRAGAILDPPL